MSAHHHRCRCAPCAAGRDSATRAAGHAISLFGWLAAIFQELTHG